MIVPGFARALKSAGPHECDWPQLALLAGRGALSHRWDRSDAVHGALAPWQRGVLDLLGLAEHAVRYRSAPTAIAGLSSAPADGYWLHAELVHFAAGLDHLAFVPLEGAMAVTAEECEALRPEIAQHLLTADLELHDMGGRWLVRSPAELDLTLTSPETAVTRALEESLPQGAHAASVRRLMTELQMLLHDHPVNQRRAQRGLPAVNAVWLWGGGLCCSPSAAPGLPKGFADEPYVRGLYRLAGDECRAAANSATELFAALGNEAAALAVIAAHDPLTMESAWFAPLAQAMREGRFAHLDLVLDEWHVSVGRFAGRRFWRRPRPPSRWPAVESGHGTEEGA